MLNWGQWQWCPWWLVDYVAAVILLLGGAGTLKHKPYCTPLLYAGWGFALGMMWMSLAGNVEQGTDPVRQGRVLGFYIFLIWFGIAYCLTGLLLALSSLKPRRL